ncbi:hypothetical protein CEXT_172321 [Caerostris extrusa]|uniref:Uncharacterized protein n=1 Tax=Caerostris extrusa TaxID=172846 RepID=A0AAV4WK04_CAEEX|nr:hypothetical protein CEXT_172321 [Caerostris extrusa]
MGIAKEKVRDGGTEPGKAVGSVVIKRLVLLIEGDPCQFDVLSWFTNEKNKQTLIMEEGDRNVILFDYIYILFSKSGGGEKGTKERDKVNTPRRTSGFLFRGSYSNP